MHLFLSPHEDDAALSCGGQIAQLTRGGERVVIFTVMGGEPPADFQQTTFTEEIHQKWGLGSNPVAARRLEDEAAARTLGAEIKFGPFADAIYRLDTQTSKAMYIDDATLFGDVNANDPVLDARRAAVVQAVVKIFDLKESDVIHAPLGVGHHVDHQLVRDMAKALVRWRPNNPVYFYEDYPYTRQGESAIQAALAALEMEVNRVKVPLDAQAIDAKIAAIKCYKSQLSGLKWETPVAMATEVRTYIAQVGGEREWRLLYVPDSPFN
jgi:LmbE family N-acetylglucosaminyl deacetylase